MLRVGLSVATVTTISLLVSACQHQPKRMPGSGHTAAANVTESRLGAAHGYSQFAQPADLPFNQLVGCYKPPLGPLLLLYGNGEYMLEINDCGGVRAVQGGDWDTRAGQLLLHRGFSEGFPVEYEQLYDIVLHDGLPVLVPISKRELIRTYGEIELWFCFRRLTDKDPEFFR